MKSYEIANIFEFPEVQEQLKEELDEKYALVSIDDMDKVIEVGSKNRCMTILSVYIEEGQNLDLFHLRKIISFKPFELGEIVF